MPGTVRRLVLLRHAKAEHAAVADELRRLTSLGVRQASGVGDTLRATGLLPELVLVSSAQRTTETWKHVSGALAGDPEPEVVLSDQLYGAHALEVVDLVKAVDTRSEAIGSAGSTADRLDGSGPCEAPQRAEIEDLDQLP